MTNLSTSINGLDLSLLWTPMQSSSAPHSSLLLLLLLLLLTNHVTLAYPAKSDANFSLMLPLNLDHDGPSLGLVSPHPSRALQRPRRTVEPQGCERDRHPAARSRR